MPKNPDNILMKANGDKDENHQDQYDTKSLHHAIPERVTHSISFNKFIQ